MNMASGVKYEETYKPGDDHGSSGWLPIAWVSYLVRKRSTLGGTTGTRFHYASIETSLIGAVSDGDA